MTIPWLLSERTLSAFIIQSVLDVSQSGVQRTLHIDNIFREAEYYFLLKNEGNKACIPRCPFQAFHPAWCCRGWSRGEGRAGCRGDSLWVPLHPKMQQLQHLSLSWGSLAPHLQLCRLRMPMSHCVSGPWLSLQFPHTCLSLQAAPWRGVSWTGSSTFPSLTPGYTRRAAAGRSPGHGSPAQQCPPHTQELLLCHSTEPAWKAV